MVAYFRGVPRTLLLIAVLAFAPPATSAARNAPAPPATKRVAEHPEPAPADRDDRALEGLLIIAGVVAVVVFVAWVASRMGDNKPHVMG
ncbi:MAG TPA: hypothetical protein VGE74_16540 [Gemmata sp.]